MSMPPPLQAVILAVVLAGGTAPCVGATDLHVPRDYPTIQDGIRAAIDGDRVIVAPGVYAEAPTITDLRIEVLGAGSEVTTIRSNGAATLALLRCGPGTRIRGFRIAKVGVRDRRRCLSVTDSVATLEDLRLVGGRHDVGGGLFATSSQVNLVRCSFIGGTAGLGGGGALFEEGHATLDQCEFEHCSADFTGGAILCRNLDQALTIRGGHFVENRSRLGAALVSIGIAVDLDGVEFRKNLAGDCGAAVKIYGPAPACSIRRCRFVKNQARNANGAIDIRDLLNSEVLVEDCLFVGQLSKRGSAVGTVRAKVRMARCTLVRNQTPSVDGAALQFDSSHWTVTDTILWNNSGTDATQLRLLDSVARISTSDVMGGENAVHAAGNSRVHWLEGNLAVAPDFRAPHLLDFRLLPGSPCVDAGSPADGASFDLDMQPRPIDADQDGTAFHDMGALEFQLASLDVLGPFLAGEDFKVSVDADRRFDAFLWTGIPLPVGLLVDPYGTIAVDLSRPFEFLELGPCPTTVQRSAPPAWSGTTLAFAALALDPEGLGAVTRTIFVDFE